MDNRLIALATYGNAFLAGRRIAFPTASHLKPGEQMRFFDAASRHTERAAGREAQAFTSSPDEWFAHLADEGITGLRLLHLSGEESWRGVWKVDGTSVAIAADRADGRVDLWHQSHDSWSRTVDYAGRTIAITEDTSDAERQRVHERSPLGIVRAIVSLQDSALDDTWYGKVLHAALGRRRC